MTWILNHPFISLCYGFLYLTVIALWKKPLRTRKKGQPLWMYLLGMTLVLGLFSDQFDLIGLVPIIVLGVSLYLSQKVTSPKIKNITLLLALLTSIGLALHKLPGFRHFIVLYQTYLSPDAIPYTIYLNLDKTIMGILILGLTHQLITKGKDWLTLIKKLWWQVLIIVPALIILALLLGFVRFDPKLPDSLIIWALTNLLFVSMAEEALFRGFIQKNLQIYFKKIRYGQYLAIIITAILFGLVHFPGGFNYVLLATIAGLGYGWVYYSTKRIEASIITHFTLNLTHFLLFTYPAIAATT